MTRDEVLAECTVENNLIRLPGVQLDRKTYLDVKKVLEILGGKWTAGKTQAFVFSSDPTESFNAVLAGDKIKNPKQDLQIFFTPDGLADEIIRLAGVKYDSVVLEPSCGQGSLLKALNRKLPEKKVFCYEIYPANRVILEEMENALVIGEDFLMADSKIIGFFDRIIANPPFNRNQDISHLRKMYELLSPGGRIVSVASTHWRHCDNKMEVAFRDWLDELGAEIIDVPENTFKESGTSVASCIIILNKSKR